MLGVQRIGRYQVLNHLATGGMGQVYLAKMTGLGGFEREVVVKTLEVMDDSDPMVEMFLDEARLVGRLHHQCIAPVFEVGKDDDRYFLVMDYIHGETAEVVFKQANELRVKLPLELALTVVRAIASALAYAHTLTGDGGAPLEIVHRDVSLSNIMLGFEGAVMLIDFGIAKSAGRATRTQAGTLKGKFGYLAPEQIVRKHVVDHRADIFALGVVLYELTTMERAFVAGSELLTLEKITKGDIKRPTKLDPSYPRGLEAIVMKALALDPGERFQSAYDFMRELEAFAREHGALLGDVHVVDTMRAVFDRPAQGALARQDTPVRFARGSGSGEETAQLTTPAVKFSPVAGPDPGDDIDGLETVEHEKETSAIVLPERRARAEVPSVVVPKVEAPRVAVPVEPKHAPRRPSLIGMWIAIALLVLAAAAGVALALT